MYEDLLPYTLATWIFTLHVGGAHCVEAPIRTACESVRTATDATAGNAAATALVEAVKARLPDGEPSTVVRFATELFGERVRTTFADPDRDVRLARIRKVQFASQLPWLARIWERNGGKVAPAWVVVERVTDEVLAADPNPWNAVDETRRYPLADFQVLWELDGLTHVHLAG